MHGCNKIKIPVVVLNNRKVILTWLLAALPASRSKNPCFCAGLTSASSSEAPLDDTENHSNAKEHTQKLATETHPDELSTNS